VVRLGAELVRALSADQGVGSERLTTVSAVVPVVTAIPFVAPALFVSITAFTSIVVPIGTITALLEPMAVAGGARLIVPSALRAVDGVSTTLMALGSAIVVSRCMSTESHVSTVAPARGAGVRVVCAMGRGMATASMMTMHWLHVAPMGGTVLRFDDHHFAMGMSTENEMRHRREVICREPTDFKFETRLERLVRLGAPRVAEDREHHARCRQAFCAAAAQLRIASGSKVTLAIHDASISRVEFFAGSRGMTR
jgi:hypothetical protein